MFRLALHTGMCQWFILEAVSSLNVIYHFMVVLWGLRVCSVSSLGAHYVGNRFFLKYHRMLKMFSFRYKQNTLCFFKVKSSLKPLSPEARLCQQEHLSRPRLGTRGDVYPGLDS